MTDPTGFWQKKLTVKNSCHQAGFVSQARVFIGMTNKTRHLRIRLSEEQFNRLAEALIIKHKTKSSLVRDAINDYVDETTSPEKQAQTHNQNKKPLK